MSSIDRISINRPEPDDFLAQERRRQLARQHQLESRETKRLVLPSIETQSRLAAKRALDERRPSSGLPAQRTSGETDADGKLLLEGELSSLAREIAGGTTATKSETAANSYPPRFMDPQLVEHDAGEGAQPESESQHVAKAAKTAIALEQQALADFEETANNRKVEDGSRRQAAVDDAYAGANWLQRLDSAMAEMRHASSASAVQALDDMLDQLLHQLQAHAAQSEPLTPELKAALEALSDQRTAVYSADPNSGDLASLQGNFSFFDAFVESMSGTSHPGSDAAGPADATLAKVVASGVQNASGNETEDAAGPDLTTDRENIAPERDRQTLYEFLELLSNISISSTPVALQQIAQARQANPEKALLRLAASGDAAVALYAPEISRRFDLISARIERDGKKSVRTSMLADAIATQKQSMQSAIDEAESIVGNRALWLRSEREQREKSLVETLPQLVLQKS